MFYSYFSTGNVEIDSEHANLDCMAELCRTRRGAWRPTAWLLMDALISHFDSEEQICAREKLNMTAAHQDEHRQLKGRIAQIEAQLSGGALDKETFLATFRDMLFYHISHFDRYLAGG